MKEYLQRHIQITMHLLIIVFAIIVGTIVSTQNQKQIHTEIEERLSRQFEYMYELASITDRNGADKDIESIVADCGRREEFEALLIRLDTLSKKDLVTVQNLYQSCGNFYAERKALMVSKLERELQMYADIVLLLKVLDENAPLVSKLTTWNDLVVQEKLRSSLLNDQSALQQKIITQLISGSTKDSKDVQALVREAQEIWDLLGVADHTTDTLRDTLKR